MRMTNENSNRTSGKPLIIGSMLILILLLTFDIVLANRGVKICQLILAILVLITYMFFD
jgi:hypothetical protein